MARYFMSIKTGSVLTEEQLNKLKKMYAEHTIISVKSIEHEFIEVRPVVSDPCVCRASDWEEV